MPKKKKRDDEKKAFGAYTLGITSDLYNTPLA